MTDKFSKTDRLLLKLLYDNDGSIFIEMMSVKYGLSIRDLAIAYRALSERNFVRTSDDDEIILTEIGKSWITSNQHLFVFSGEKTWRKVPDRFKGPKIDPNSPYAPRRSRLPIDGLLGRQKRKKR